MSYLNNVLQLNSLPKATQTKLTFKRTTPGSYSRLLLPSQVRHPGRVVGPSHPWAKLHPQSYRKLLPAYRSSKLSIYAYPKALLSKPEHPHPDPPFTPYRPSKNSNVKNEVVDISLMMHVPKTQAKSSVIRNTLRKKIKFAFELIVKRGARVEEDHNGQEILVGGPPDKSICMPRWTYVMSPTIEMYPMSYVDIVKLLSSIMPRVNQIAQNLEKNWEDKVPPDGVREKGNIRSTKGNGDTKPVKFGLKGTSGQAEGRNGEEQIDTNPLEGLKRILNTANKGKETQQEGKNKVRQRKSTTNYISSREPAPLDKKTGSFKQPTTTETNSLTMDLLKEHRFIRVDRSAPGEQEQLRERRLNDRGWRYSR